MTPRKPGASPPRLIDPGNIWWLKDAACKKMDSSEWHPHVPRAKRSRGPIIDYNEKCRKLKAICDSCPALEPCREYALSKPEPLGFWAGMDEIERRRVVAERRRASAERRRRQRAENAMKMPQ